MIAMKQRFSLKFMLWLGLSCVGATLSVGVAHAQEETFAQGELAQESGGNFSATNTSSTAIGGYQMTEAALASAGYITINGPITAADDNGNMSNVTWTGQGGITSESQFLASPAAQTAAFNTYAGQTWSADQSLGISNDVGQTVGGQTLNQSAILGGSYLLGAGGMQSYIANGGQVWETASGAPCSAGSAGCTFNQSLTQNAQSYIANASQEDSSAITGADATVAESAAGTSDAGGGSTSSLYCASSVATLLQQGSLQYVQQQQALVTNPSTGFTLLNGNSIAQAAGLLPGASSIGGSSGNFGEFSCLSNLLGGNLNVLFEPPNLSALLQELENAVCSAGEQMVQNLVQPIEPNMYDSTNLGGFFPGMSLPSLGGGISTSFSQGGSSSGISVSGLGGSTSWYGTPTSISPPTYFTNLLESP
jgi:hypothetical protein